MPTPFRWMLAGLVILCVIVAPLHAPRYGFAEPGPEPTESTNDVAVASDAIDDVDPWHGVRFPGDPATDMRMSLFDRLFTEDMLIDRDGRSARAGAGGMGGGSLDDLDFDFEAMSMDGSRVFPLAEGSFRISQHFGCVTHNHGYSNGNDCPPERPSFHTGVDFAAETGTTIYAAASGTVNFSDIDRASQSGNSVIRIIHDGSNSGYITDYLHWESSFVEAGEHVMAGQPIGTVGSIGYSTGPHLHFGVYDASASEYVEPLDWLKGSESLQVAAGDGGVGGVDGVMRWATYIEAASARHGIPAALIAAIMTVESGGNPDVVSPAGAQGLMQVMPMHFERYGIDEADWRDPETNIDAASRLLAELVERNETLTNAVGAYFGFGCDVLGTCTAEYVSKVFGWYNHYVPIFSGVAVDTDGFEFDLPDPGDSGFPSADDADAAPTPTPGDPATPPEGDEEHADEGSDESDEGARDDEDDSHDEDDASDEDDEATPPDDDDEHADEGSDDGDEGSRDDEDDSHDDDDGATPPEDDDEHADEGVDDGDEGAHEDDEESHDDEDATDEDDEATSPEDDDEHADEGADDGDESAHEDDEDAHDDEDAADEEGGDEPYEPVGVQGHGSDWVLDQESNAVTRVDLESGEVVAAIEVGAAPYAVVMSETSVWVSVPGVNHVLRIDPETNAVANTIEVGEAPLGLAVTHEGVWAANSASGTLSLISTEQLEVVDTVEVEIAPCDIWASDEGLIASDCETGEEIGIDRE